MRKFKSRESQILDRDIGDLRIDFEDFKILVENFISSQDVRSEPAVTDPLQDQRDDAELLKLEAERESSKVISIAHLADQETKKYPFLYVAYEIHKKIEKEFYDTFLPKGYYFDCGINSNRIRLCQRGEYGRCHYLELSQAALYTWITTWIEMKCSLSRCENQQSGQDLVNEIYDILLQYRGRV